jgi:6-phosphogluconate dehydrogenase
MRIGMVGLGRMGANMAERLIRGGHEVVAYDVSADAVGAAAAAGAEGATSLQDLLGRLDSPRIVWIMLPAGDITEGALATLADGLDPGDVVIDGGNANYRDTQRRATELAGRGITLIDVGTSGGVWGRDEGYSLMVGGDEAAAGRLTPLFETLAPAPDRGWARVGPSGAGHFVKMIHNGIEYGMMQAMAEGFAMMERKEELALDLPQVARVWQHGSVVRSWLLDLTALALEEDAALAGIAPWVGDSGEGRWAVAEAIDLDVPAPVITLSLLQRLRSRDTDSYADRLLAAMRQQFGGHAIRHADGGGGGGGSGGDGSGGG